MPLRTTLDPNDVLAGLHMRTADDLFGGPQGSPRTDKLIAAFSGPSGLWEKIDERFAYQERK